VLVATDGSPQARAAVRAAAGFPWPARTRPRVVLARGDAATARWPVPAVLALTRGLAGVADSARRVLATRWPDADMALPDALPIDGILGEARRIGARAIVLGSRGHGRLGRFVLGSVSRGVVRRAPCATLVVKGRLPETRRLVIALDGSANAHRAVAFVASLPPPAGGRVTLVRIVEALRQPATGLLPGAVRGAVRAATARLEAQRAREARQDLAAAARRLARAGWPVRSLLRTGVPVPEILRLVEATRAHVLVVGARGVGGVERLLLGSVADAVLSRSPVSVLIVR
jgi:nucleotide-binding universal stress UspA family protein